MQRLDLIKDWLRGEATKRHLAWDSIGWTSEVVKAFPTTRLCDSGVIMLAHVEFMKQDLPLCFDESDVDHFRYRFSLQMLSSAD